MQPRLRPCELCKSPCSHRFCWICALAYVGFLEAKLDELGIVESHAYKTTKHKITDQGQDGSQEACCQAQELQEEACCQEGHEESCQEACG